MTRLVVGVHPVVLPWACGWAARRGVCGNVGAGTGVTRMVVGVRPVSGAGVLSVLGRRRGGLGAGAGVTRMARMGNRPVVPGADGLSAPGTEPGAAMSARVPA